MECRPLELRIIKANDLKDVNLMSKMDVYAVVSISGDNLNNPQVKTQVDKDGGTNPKWNFSVRFTVDVAAVHDNRLTLKIKLVSDRSLGDKEIGVVFVQVKELFDSGNYGDHEEKEKEEKEEEEKPEQTGSYSVRLSNGKAKGNLELGFRFGKKFKFEPPPLPLTAVKTADAPPMMAYPPAYAGSTSAYPHPQAPYPPPQGAYAYPPPPGAYPYPPPQGAYPPPPPGYGGYPPAVAPGYGGYGGYAAPPPRYGYPPMQQPPKKSGGGSMALGLGAGLLGGLLVGDMISDVGEMAAYDADF